MKGNRGTKVPSQSYLELRNFHGGNSVLQTVGDKGLDERPIRDRT
jgi:hypothetical protein